MSNGSSSKVHDSQRNQVRPSTSRSFRRFGGVAALFAAVAMIPAQAMADGGQGSSSSSFTLFETGQVRPLAMSPDGQHLYAINTPDNSLEVFHISNDELEHVASVTVGLEPVAVAARNNNEVWVVNHLSDSVSVVDMTFPWAPRVKRTLLVADEPRDIVFAGAGKNRAFITTAHRGQNAPYDPQLSTPGVGRADVWVYDANNLGDSTLGGTPLTIISLFSDTPRSLTVTPDGTRVYAAGFHTGNKTTAVHRNIVETEPNMPPRLTDYTGAEQPPTARIVKHDGTKWVDSDGHDWSHGVRFTLPDKDVFVLDAMADPPAQLTGNAGFYTGVGTILFNMAVNPVNGKVYVTNTDANNLNRFAGPGIFAGTTVRGHLHESRISVLSPTGGVASRHLNKHIDYNAYPAPPAVNEKSLATPMGMAVSPAGDKLYVAAFGSSKIGIFNTAEIENNTFVPNAANHIALQDDGEPVGPTGLLLNSSGSRLYVFSRFNNAVTVINPVTKSVLDRKHLHNPEPQSVREGRRFLYDARYTSSNGEASCASCHVFGDFDSLAWDLGNPDAGTSPMPGPVAENFPPFFPLFIDFRSLKGPMTTQSLRGMANHGPMHWRGDRTKGDEVPSAQPNSGSFDEVGAFEEFQEAFAGLLGRTGPLTANEMTKFADFSLQIMYPPNPIRNLDNTLTAFQEGGRQHFFQPGVDLHHSCEDCHKLDPDANAEFGEPIPGFFGTDGRYVTGEIPQTVKVPHLRNLYQKVGMFGMPQVFSIIPGDNGQKGDQVRGFGMLNDGAEDTVFRFMMTFGFDKLSGFPPNGFDDSPGADGEVKRRQVEAYMMAFDSNLAPIVGQQVTLHQANTAAANTRIDLLLQRADVGECDVIAKVRIFGQEYGFLYTGAGQFRTSYNAEETIGRAVLTLVAQAPNHAVTFTAVPPGTGERIGLGEDHGCED